MLERLIYKLSKILSS